MPGRLNVSLKDFEGKVGSAQVFVPLFTAGNFTAQNALMDTLVTAIEGVTLLNKTGDLRLASDTGFAAANPTDPNAQRGIKWLVRMREAGTGNAVIFRIPGADLALLSAGSENMDIAAGAGLALVNAIEAVVVSNDGTGVTVEEIVYLD